MRLLLTSRNNSRCDLEVELVINKKFGKNRFLFKKIGFEGKDGDICLLTQDNKVFVGITKLENELIKEAMASLIRKIKKTNYKKIKIKAIKDYIGAFTQGLILGGYEFNKYKSEKKEKNQTFILVVESLTQKSKREFNEAKIISEIVNKTRDLINTSPDDIYPQILANYAKNMAEENTLEYEILDKEKLKKQDMNALLSVSRASRHTPAVIHLTYKPKNVKKKIVLVGKGLTYDSGGLSLKPSDFMVTMKADKSGACVILGIIEAISKLKLDIEVHAIAGLVENMIGGDAYKPDDVLKAKNGKTIEVRNTDAEGRLVLADCLCYAQEKINDFDYIFDFATLTGACVVGVGQYTIGVMGNKDILKYNAVSFFEKAGEFATSLPFNKYLRKKIDSKIADICNIASTKYGGALTAGLFLNEFIEEKNKDKWLHFDIAGPSYVEEEWGYNPYGASGAGVRGAVEFIKNL